MAKSTVILLLAGGVVGFVAASVTLALTGALTAFGRNTRRYGAARGTLLTISGAMVFALHFLPGRWGLLSVAGAVVIAVVATWRQLVLRRDRPIHEQLRERLDPLDPTSDLRAARVRRARSHQAAAIVGATALAVLGAAVDQPWVIAAGFVAAVATVAVSALDVHRLQLERTLAAPGAQPPAWRRILDLSAAALLAASITGIGAAVRALTEPPTWNHVQDGHVLMAYERPSGNAGVLALSAALAGEPSDVRHPRAELELWHGTQKLDVLRLVFGTARPDGSRTLLASEQYDPATRRASPLPAGTSGGVKDGDLWFRTPAAAVRPKVTGWRLVVPSPWRGFDAGLFPPDGRPTPVSMIRPPRPLHAVTVTRVTARLRGHGRRRSVEGTLRFRGPLPRTATTSVAIDLASVDQFLQPVDPGPRNVTLVFGRERRGTRSLADVLFRTAAATLHAPQGVDATLVGHVVRFRIPLRTLGAAVCCYRATLSVQASDGGTTESSIPRRPQQHPLPLPGADAPARFPRPVGGLVVRSVRTSLEHKGTSGRSELRATFDVPSIPGGAASMLYVVQLTRRGGFPGVTVLVALNAAGRSLHATRRYLHVDPLAGPGPDESDLPASAVSLPARGGRLTLRVPLPRISRNFCCWIASVTASKPDGSAPVTYNVRPQSLGRAGRAVDLSR